MTAKARILVVDDEQEIREMLARHFKFEGYEVVTAVNGKDALKKLADERFDVMISDIMMPEMNGVDLLKTVRREYPMVRVIMITGYVTLENALMCMKHQADTCIFKPLQDLKELEEAVKKSVAHLQRWQQIFMQLQHMKDQSQVKKTV